MNRGEGIFIFMRKLSIFLFIILNLFSKEKYIFEHSFITELNKDTIIERLFDFSLMKSNENLMRIYLVDSGLNFQIVRFEYNYLLFKPIAIYKREKDNDSKIVRFFLIQYIGNNKIFPDVLAETGYYEIKDTISRSLVHYYQETIFDRKPDILYMNLYKNGMKKFYKELERILR